MAGVLPVILCGKTTKIAIGVIAALKPEMDGNWVLFLPQSRKKC